MSEERTRSASSRWLLVLSAIVSLIASIVAFVPFNPEFPSPGLDPSWRFATNQAVAQGLAYGRDLTFTFGPYASIYTTMYHPATDSLMLGGSLLLALAFWAGMLLLAVGRRIEWLLLAPILLSWLLLRDSLLLSVPLLLLLVVCRMQLPVGHPDKLAKTGPRLLAIAVLLIAQGLLAFVKGTLALESTMMIGLGSLLLWRTEKRLIGLGLLITLGSALALWHLAGQPVSALPQYALSLRQIVSGYSEAMAIPSRMRDVYVFCAYSLAVLCLLGFRLVRNRATSSWSEKVSLLAIGLTLFLTFKASFVRHPGHQMIGSGMVILIGWIISLQLSRRLGACLLLGSVAASAAMTVGSDGAPIITPTMVLARIPAVDSAALLGIRERWFIPGTYAKRFEERLSWIRREQPLMPATGTADIYPFDQAALFAHGLKWAPRPVLQTYSAYTHELAQRDADHLLGPRAAQNIYFSIQPIDNRLPALEDGLSWPLFFSHYTIAEFKERVLRLKRREPTLPAPTPGIEVHHGTHSLGEEIPLALDAEPLWAEIDIEPTLIGKLGLSLYKPATLLIHLQLADGTQREFRLVAAIARGGFLLSPVIEQTTEFALLASPQRLRYLARRRPVSMRIEEVGRLRNWRAAFTLRIRKLDLPVQPNLDEASLFDPVQQELPVALESRDSLPCVGHIDIINGRWMAEASTTVGGLLHAYGWVAVKPDEGRVYDSVFLSVKSRSGAHSYIPARRVIRPDLLAALKHEGLDAAGFEATINATLIDGDFDLDVIPIYQGKARVCPLRVAVHRE